MRESAIEGYLVRRTHAHGGVAYKFTGPGRRGVPDRNVHLPGGVQFYVEVKATGEEPTPGQLREHERLRALGARVYVVDSKEDVDAVLRLEAGPLG